LTVDMIRELERILQISASVLVNNYKLANWKITKGNTVYDLLLVIACLRKFRWNFLYVTFLLN
jgi:hypothetical protein